MGRRIFADICKLGGKIICKDFIGFDCETISSEKNIFRLGSFVFSDTIHFTFYTKKEMIKFIYDNKRLFQGKFIVATNLQFDLMALFYDEEEFNDLNILWSKSRIICAQLKFKDSNKHGKIIFVDTLNYNLASVKELGKLINIPKMEISEKLFEKKKLTDKETKLMREYNINDSLISMKFMYYFQTTLNNLGGNIKLTTPSCAMDLFRRKFIYFDLIKEQKILDYGIVKDAETNKIPNIIEWIFKSYYGGRCENFVKGDFKNVYYYDVNSLYPTMMLNCFPSPQSIKIPRVADVQNIYDYMGVTECIIKAPDDLNIPILPYRSVDGKTLFPIGEFWGIWTHELLTYALNNGYVITHIFKQIIYTKKIRLFEDYVDSLYKLRMQLKSEHNPEEQNIKLFLNSLYGKFGQKKNTIYEIMPRKNMTDKLLNKKMNENYEIIESADRKFYILSKEGNKYPKNSFPIIASYVTSYAMIHMHKLYMKYKPLYTDTDSIMTQIKIEDVEIIGPNLGQLKVEKVGNVNFQYPKCYLFDSSPTIKGIHFDKQLSNKEKKDLYYRYINGEKIEQRTFIKLKASLKRIKDIKPNEIIYFTKQSNNTSEKRIFNKDGTSKPIKIIDNLILRGELNGPCK